jgi:DNA-binding LacI/PurR family transcriptional regulator
VARAAGVDKSTVSRVLNGKAGKGRIAPATQNRVIAAARQLGYTLNPKALFTETQHQAIPAMQPTGSGLPSRQIGLILSPESPTATLAQIPALEPILAAADYQLVVMTLPTDVTAAQARLTKLLKGWLASSAAQPFIPPYHPASRAPAR